VAGEPKEINRVAITGCIMLATLIQALDTTIANVALPYMQGSLAASQDQINWVLTSYIVGAAIMTPPTGWLTQRFGRTRVLMTAIAGFTLTSVLCGLAQSLDQIVLFRFLQGTFGASLVPLSQTVMLDIYPRESQGKAMAIWGMGVMIGPILGPTLGGWLTEFYNWRWVFYINVPLGLLAFLGVARYLGETARDRTRPFDWFGFAALSLCLGAFQLMLDRGEQLDWFGSTEIIIETCLAGLGLYAFFVHSALSEHPFISPRLFTDRNFVVGVGFMFMVSMILFSTMSLMAPFLQNQMGYPVLDAGIALAPRGAGTMLSMMVVGRLIGRVDARLLVMFGFGTMAVSLWEMTGFTPDVSERTIIITGFYQGIGMGFVFTSLSTLTFATLLPELRAQATSVFALMRSMGGAIGISMLSSLLVSSGQANHADIAGYVTPFNRLLQTGMAAQIWNPTSLAGRAALDGEVTRQAMTIAYLNDFWLITIIAFLAMPFIMMLKSPGRAAVKTAEPAIE
jgi:DHA2 family multidrug resistance protein